MTEASSSSWDPPRWLQVGGLIAMALGLVLPWASLGIIDATGLDTDDGKLFGVLLLVAVWAVVRLEGGRWAWWVVGLLGAALLAFAVFEMLDLGDKSFGRADVHFEVSIGTGLWLDAIGAAAMVAGALARRARPLSSSEAQ